MGLAHTIYGEDFDRELAEAIRKNGLEHLAYETPVTNDISVTDSEESPPLAIAPPPSDGTEGEMSSVTETKGETGKTQPRHWIYIGIASFLLLLAIFAFMRMKKKAH